MMKVKLTALSQRPQLTLQAENEHPCNPEFRVIKLHHDSQCASNLERGASTFPNRGSTCNSSGDENQRSRGAQRPHCPHAMPLKNSTKIKLNERTNKKNNRKSRVIVSAVLKSFLLVSLIAASYSNTNFVRIFRQSL